MARLWAVAAVALLLAACQQQTSGHPHAVVDIAPPTPTPTPTSTVTATPSDGSWSGQTSQGTPITFTISNGVITEIVIEGRYGGESCATSTKYSASGSIDIVAGRFHKTSYGGGRTVIDGTFTSSTSATGTASLTPTEQARGNGCVPINVTWQANKSG